MDPISVISIVSAVYKVTEVVARSLKGLVQLKGLYKSADLLVVIIIGHLHTVEAILCEIRAWLEQLGHPSLYTNVLGKIHLAVGCCAVVAEALLEKINGLTKTKEGEKLTARGKLLYMLGEDEIKEMNMHLGRQVQALHILIDAARLRTPQERHRLLEDVETRTVLSQIQDDSSSYVQTRSEIASVLTQSNRASDIRPLTDSNFEFDSVILDSRVYRNVFGNALQQQDDLALREYVVESSKLGMKARSQSPQASTVQLQSSDSLEGAFSSIKISGEGSVKPKMTRPQDVNLLRKRRRGAQASDKQLREEEAQRETDTNMGMIEGSTESVEKQEMPKGEAGQPANSNDRIHLGLFGTSESGKTTILKNIRRLLHGPFGEAEVDDYRLVVRSNLHINLVCILEGMRDECVSLPDPVSQWYAQILLEFEDPTPGHPFPVEIVQAILHLRDDPTIRECLARPDDFDLSDYGPFFIDDAERIFHPEYTPTEEDMLGARLRTLGITETSVEMQGVPYIVYDVGGVRSERKKWTHLLPLIQVVLFTVDCSNYNQRLLEQAKCNRMLEQLMLFEGFMALPWFAKVSWHLVFTKVDRLGEKIQNIPMQEYAPDYTGGADLDKAIQYIIDQFLILNKDPGRIIHVHLLKDLTTDSLGTIFHTMHRQIIRDRAEGLCLSSQEADRKTGTSSN